MIVDLNATADIRGECIRLSWTWRAMDGGRPDLKLLRRRQTHPGSDSDGYEVMHLSNLFRAPDIGWARIRSSRFLIVNTGAENGLEQARYSLFFTAMDDDLPEQVHLSYYDIETEAQDSLTLSHITRIQSNDGDSPNWGRIETHEIFNTPPGESEIPAGTVGLFFDHQDGTTPDRLLWTPPGGPSVSVPFQQRRELSTFLRESSVGPESARFIFETTMDQAPLPLVLQNLSLDELYDPDTGEWEREFTLTDHGLLPEEIYYYSLFEPHPAEAGVFITHRPWRVSAMATGRYGLESRLYEMLPAVHKQYDEPSPNHPEEGQLRTFLRIFGAASDQLRSLEEGLALRHDIMRAPPSALIRMARWIGWEPDLTLDEYARRRDILMAPEVFRSVGTLPNIRALVNRVTGWPCRTKEFVNNIFLTNAPETIRLWEIWRMDHDGADWGAPEAVTVTDGFDGGPSVVVVPVGELWLFMHSDLTGPREILFQRPGIDPLPIRAAEGAPDDTALGDAVDESPSVVAEGSRIWMFYGSRRDKRWDIWVRTFDGLPGNASARLTDHAGEDRAPAALIDSGGQIRLFWQSNRRGPADIWAMDFDGAGWGLPRRITTAVFRHESPAAVLDGGGRIWLFWVDDTGDRRNLHYRIFDGNAWGDPIQLTFGRHRDESPSAVFLNGGIRLFWHSNRGGRQRIWERFHDGVDWNAGIPVTSDVAGDKEPSAVVTAGGNLSLFFRSRRRGRNYLSRTFDSNDPGMTAALGTYEDRAHYTYDTRTEADGGAEEARHARDRVGLYLSPDTGEPAEVRRRLTRARDFVEPFRPVPVRFVWLTDTTVTEELINTDGLIEETFEDDIA